MFTFGAYLKSSEFNLLQSFLSTFFAFALPGQFVMAETLISGGNLINIFFAVLFTNARLFPMTMHIIPTIRSKKINKWKWWYPLQTAKTIVQSVGRSVRSSEDHAVTYILDSNWGYFFQKNKDVFPEDFKKCIL